jgi:nucleoid-associated protein YgaU
VRSGTDLRAGVGRVGGSAKEEPMGDETKPGGAWDATQWHEVKPGDTLWKIAEQYYGDGSLYTKIFEANKDVLDDPNKIKVGQKLRIP